MISLDIMHSKPGVYRVAMLGHFFFVEVDVAGKCYQLKPRTLEREGELRPGSWNLRNLRRIDGPYKRPQITLPR